MPDFGFSAASLQSSEKFAPYSKVVLKTDDYDSSQVKTYTAGDDSGRVLEYVMPWASQEIANSILESITGYSYQPISAKGVIVDPATELGDDITVGGVSGFIENQDISFGGILRADISAPGEEQIDHEYQFIVKRDRKSARNFSAVGGAIRANKELIRQASVSLIADIGDVRAGLYAIATADDIKGFKEGKTTLFAQIQDENQALQAGIEARVTSKEFGKYKEAVATTYATIDNVNAGLNLKAEKKTVEDLNGRVSVVETATADLSARVGDAEASLKLKASQDSVTGLSQSVATLSADVINLKGRVDLTGWLSIREGGGITANGPIYAPNQLISGGEVACADLRASRNFYYRDRIFEPTEITSTTGAVMALGYT